MTQTAVRLRPVRRLGLVVNESQHRGCVQDRHSASAARRRSASNSSTSERSFGSSAPRAMRSLAGGRGLSLGDRCCLAIDSPQHPPPEVPMAIAPVWSQLSAAVRCGQRRSGASPDAGSAKRTPPRCAHCADSRDRRRDRVGRLSHHTGQAVIVALRRAQRPVWAPGVRILGRPPIIRRRSRTSSIVDRAPIAWVRWGGPNREKTIAPPGVLRSSGRRRRRPAETAPRSTVPHSGHGSGSC